MFKNNQSAKDDHAEKSYCRIAPAPHDRDACCVRSRVGGAARAPLGGAVAALLSEAESELLHNDAAVFEYTEAV